VRKRPFTEEEDTIILDHVEHHGPTKWSDLAAQLGNRTAKQLRERWFHHVDPIIPKKPWTPEEDQIIVAKQAEYGNKWVQIAHHLPGRSDAAIKDRWNLRLSRSPMRQDSSISDARLRALTFPDELGRPINSDFDLWLRTSSQGNVPSPKCPPDWFAPLTALVSRKDKTG
jgi:myb proto-oncogene protein